MPVYQKESLENLRRKIDLVEVLSSHIDLKRTGAAYKGLCPFHDEKTPSFMIQKGDVHYHCFGCGAHGDAIQFMMNHLKMSFSDSVESLAQKFQVHLEVVDAVEEKGPNKKLLIQALNKAAELYHFLLLHTQEGHNAVRYLIGRGIDMDFIQQFQLGLAPQGGHFLEKALNPPFDTEILQAAGLISTAGKDFFHDRITIPIHNPMGAVIGFSARKYKDQTFGGKYVNTSETPLFKKSRILFGLNYCRRRIAKERKAIIVEGQIDALRLIKEGFNITVAGQGTAFGEGHVQELKQLGVNQVYLALDSDAAGQEAILKIGNLFQKIGVEVLVIQMPSGKDPDGFLKEHGAEAFLELMHKSQDYLTFAVGYYGKRINLDSPAAKSELVHNLSTQIRSWDDTVMVHESLRKLALLLKMPEEMIGVGQHIIPNLLIQKSASVGMHEVDPDRVIEADLLLWLIRFSNEFPQFVEIAQQNILPENFRIKVCRSLYDIFMTAITTHQPHDFMTLVIQLQEPDGQYFLDELFRKKVNREKAESCFIESLKKFLERNWMQKREEIKMKIQSGQHSDEEAINLLKAFDELKRNPPVIKGLT